MEIAALIVLIFFGVRLLGQSAQPADAAPNFSFDFGGSDPGPLDDAVTWFDSAVNEVIGGAVTRTQDEIVTIWADAIQQFEGWYPGSHSFRNNNPGNLEINGDLVPPRDSSGFGRFSSYAAGRAALEADLRAKLKKYPGYTIYQIMARYAPPTENDTQAYANAVAAALGVSTDTTLGELG